MQQSGNKYCFMKVIMFKFFFFLMMIQLLETTAVYKLKHVSDEKSQQMTLEKRN